MRYEFSERDTYSYITSCKPEFSQKVIALEYDHDPLQMCDIWQKNVAYIDDT